ncbi:MAG TPA: DUF3096 domain-containing protein, partial [Candidatus Omnitrophota bacterium]|nr:DUF3096 domain-containing protein [Candidatus Omnitrophota bacterium]
MLLGVLFIIAGVLIAVYPPLLSFVVAFMLIAAGVIIIGIS